MELGYARVSKSDGTQKLDLQLDAFQAQKINRFAIYMDKASGGSTDRPALKACLKALRKGDTLVVWKLDRLGRNLKDLINIIEGLNSRGVGFRVLAGHGGVIDTSTPNGRLIFSIFAALAEFEREIIRERTKAGLKAARKRGRNGGRKFALTKAKVRLAQSAMGKPETCVASLCKEIGITRAALYKYVSPTGELRDYGKRVLGVKQ